MKQVFSGMLVVLALGIPIYSEAQLAPKPVTFHNAADAVGNGTAIEVGQYNSVGFDVDITDTAEVTFEILAKSGGTWRAMACVLAGDTTNTLITTLSSSGSVQCNIAGMASFRVRISSYTGGTVSASGRATIAVLARRGGSGSGSGITADASFPGSPSTNQLFLITDDSAAGECDSDAGSAVTLCRWDGANWVAVNIIAEADTLQAVFGRGNIINTAVSFATALKLLDENGDGYAWYVDPTDGPKFVCVDNNTENACASYTRTLAAGQTLIYKNSGGTNIFHLDEATGALSATTFSTSNNAFTSYKRLPGCGGDLVAVDPATSTAGHIWDKVPSVTAPTATASVLTNQSVGLARFPDSDGDFGIQIKCRLPANVTIGQVDAVLTWVSAGTGNYRPQIFTKCYGDDVAADAAYNSAQPFTLAAGTATRGQIDTLSNLTMTGCSAGNEFFIKLIRNRTEASDTGSSTFDVKSFELWATITE